MEMCMRMCMCMCMRMCMRMHAHAHVCVRVHARARACACACACVGHIVLRLDWQLPDTQLYKVVVDFALCEPIQVTSLNKLVTPSTWRSTRLLSNLLFANRREHSPPRSTHYINTSPIITYMHTVLPATKRSAPFHHPSITLPSPFHHPSITLPSPFHHPSITFHHPSITLPAPFQHPSSTFTPFHAHHLLITCPSLLITCSSPAHHLPITCPSPAHHLPITCLSNAHHLRITCPSPAHHLPICPSSAHHLPITCTPPAHHLLITCSSLLTACPSPAHHLPRGCPARTSKRASTVTETFGNPSDVRISDGPAVLSSCRENACIRT